MKKAKNKLALFPRMSESLLVTIPKGIEVFYLVAKNSAEENWIKSFLPVKNILSYTMKKTGYSSSFSTYSVMKYSDISKILKTNNISHLLIATASSKEKQQWADKNGITLVYTDFNLQQKYENKLWFDPFLKNNNLPKPESFIYNYSQNKYNIPFSGKVVLQRGKSLGNDGTYILNNIREVENLVKKGEINGKADHLLREFIQGTTYAIDVFISPEKISLSQLRVQCFFENNTAGFKFFNGVQFVKSSTLSKKLKSDITKTFQKLGFLLAQDNFIGYASFDFIVDKNEKIYLLECNPRFTTSSPLLVKFPEVFNNIDTSKIFIKSVFKINNKKNFSITDFPENDFSGSVLRLLVEPHSRKNEVMVKRVYPIGVYELKNNKINFLTPDVRLFSKNKKQFIYYCDVRIGEKYSPNQFVSEIFSNFPLYDSLGKVNSDAKILIEYFNLFTKSNINITSNDLPTFQSA